MTGEEDFYVQFRISTSKSTLDLYYCPNIPIVNFAFRVYGIPKCENGVSHKFGYVRRFWCTIAYFNQYFDRYWSLNLPSAKISLYGNKMLKKEKGALLSERFLCAGRIVICKSTVINVSMFRPLNFYLMDIKCQCICDGMRQCNKDEGLVRRLHCTDLPAKNTSFCYES